MRADDLASKGRLNALPYAVRPARALEITPIHPRDGVIEADQRLSDPVLGAVLPECVLLVCDHADVLQHCQWVREVGRLSGKVARDTAAAGISVGDRGEHRMIERGITEGRLLGEEIPSFAKQGPSRIQHCAHHPVVEVCWARRAVPSMDSCTYYKSSYL
ncbi:hypothetical protein NBRGN_050_00310 [Nocardia brasiliensis NBRC 14402]|nr:hypothetical protein NBRGN_050_00310 [Nocardia brasiliensis NBRC 14402]